MFSQPSDSSLVKILNVTGRSFKRCPMCEPALCGFLRCAPLFGSLLFLLWVLALTPTEGYSQVEPEGDAPLLLSISPLTGQPGNLLKVEARGNRLEGAYSVWSENSGITGKVVNVEEVRDLVKPRV